jgi:hypothetical protein
MVIYLDQERLIVLDCGYIVLLQCSRFWPAIRLPSINKVQEIVIPNGIIKYVRCGSEVLVRFSDIQDAISAYMHAKVTHPEWSVEYIGTAAYAEVRSLLCARSAILSILYSNPLIDSSSY